VDRTGRLDIPADPRRLGWWIGAARPGDAQGTVLIAGHVDTAEAGRGALFRLESLRMGATVEVAAAGQVFRYRVNARRGYAKTRLPADLFATAGPPRLAMVTCGGGFSHGAYDSNLVVNAEPVP
jgi:sortase (surface protein transpeptidase)